MIRQGARRRGRKDEKRLSCWRARSESVRSEQRAIDLQRWAAEQAENGWNR